MARKILVHLCMFKGWFFSLLLCLKNQRAGREWILVTRLWIWKLCVWEYSLKFSLMRKMGIQPHTDHITDEPDPKLQLWKSRRTWNVAWGFTAVTHSCITTTFVENTDTWVLKNASHFGVSKGFIFSLEISTDFEYDHRECGHFYSLLHG